MADDTVSIRMRLTGGKAVATEARAVSGAMRGVGTSAAAGSTMASRATSGISRAVGRLRGAWEGIKRVAKVGAIAAAAGVAILAAKLKQAVTDTLDLSMTVAGLHRNLGLAHKSATGWAVAAKARGIETTSLNMAFKTLSQQMLQAKRGSDTAQQAFGDVGVRMQDIRRGGDDVNGMLTLLAKRFGNAEGGFKRQQAAGKLLGRGYQKLLPMFATGAEGLKEQLNWSNKYHVAQNLHIEDTQGLVTAQRESKAAWAGIQTALASAVIPELTKAHGKFQSFAAVLTDPKISREQKISMIGNKIKTGLTKAFDWVVNVGLPQFASRMGQAAPKVAAGFVRGFMKANTWGKLFIGAWLFTKLGGMGALAGVSGRAGAKIGKGLGMAFLKAVAPMFAAEVAASGSLGAVMNARFGRMKPMVAKWGGRLGRAFGLAFITFGGVQIGQALDDKLGNKPLVKLPGKVGDVQQGAHDVVDDALGAVFGNARGGWITPNGKGPRAAASDTVPRLLTPYEFVVRAPVARRHGALLERLNRGGEPPIQGAKRLPGTVRSGGGSRQPIVLQLDGRVLAETTVRLQEDEEARK